MSFKDHFSRAAADYARFRPDYPGELFAYLADVAPARRWALDSGTGSGQAAAGLAAHFDRVVASDASIEQVRQGRRVEGLSYLVCAAEATPLAPGSMDLIVASQAVHWFDLDAFYTEVRRLARPGGVLAVWCYNLPAVAGAVDGVVERLYRDVVGPFWPAERSVVEGGYRDLPFPFDELAGPEMALELDWTLAELEGYLGTWSSAQGYRRATGLDPLDEIRTELADAWGAPGRRRRVTWPLLMRVGRV